MALIKEFEGTSKYYYAVIVYIGYCKDHNLEKNMGTGHLVSVKIVVKDKNDPTFQQDEQDLRFDIPAVKLTEGLEDWEGVGILEIDPNYVDPLCVDNMQPEDSNVVKLAYEWLKDNILMFNEYKSD